MNYCGNQVAYQNRTLSLTRTEVALQEYEFRLLPFSFWMSLMPTWRLRNNVIPDTTSVDEWYTSLRLPLRQTSTIENRGISAEFKIDQLIIDYWLRSIITKNRFGI
jgi:hypothetical protein